MMMMVTILLTAVVLTDHWNVSKFGFCDDDDDDDGNNIINSSVSNCPQEF